MKSCVRTIAILMTMSLIITFTPLPTFAENEATIVSMIIDCLIDEDIDTAQYYNQQLPETAKEECVANMSASMKTSYGETVKSWENKKQDGNYVFYDYWLTDIDNDGSAELLLNLVPDYAGAITYVYQYKNGKVVEVGSFSGNESCHAYPDNNGIVTEGGKMGYNWLSLITLEEGQVEVTPLISYEASGDYFQMRNNLKSHSKWNGNRYVPVYDDIIESNASSATTIDSMMKTSSAKYNNTLALLSAEMSEAAYKDGSEGIENYLKGKGFKSSDIHSNNYSSGLKLGSLAFTIATKEMDGSDNTDIMVIVARGSTNWYELFQDSFSVADKEYGNYKVYGVVNDFNNAIKEYYDKYKKSGRKYKVLLTGHSLGGASVNLFAAKLNKEWGKQNVYCYTFGAINSIKRSIPVTKGYENIHNVYNNKDTFAPGQFSRAMKNGAGSKYGKFGHLETFEKDWRSASDKKKIAHVQIMDHINHDMHRYVEAVKTIKNGKGSSIKFNRHCSDHYKTPAKTKIKKINGGKKSIKLTWKKVTNNTPGGTKGYQIQYCTNKNFIKTLAKSKIIKNSKTLNTKISKLSGGKIYYVRIRSFIKYKDITFYSSWSGVKKVKTKK